MISVIIGFGILMMVAGAGIVASPGIIFGPLKRRVDQPGLQVVAIIARLMLGILLLSHAELSGYPTIIAILGWLSIAGAVLLFVIGQNRFKSLMRWAFGIADRFGRAAGLVAILFGAFLVHAFV